MRLHASITAALLLVALSGCQRKRFEIVMQLSDEGVRRTVSTWTEEDVDSNGNIEVKFLGSTDSNGLAAIYGQPEQLQDGRSRYSGVFTGDLPSDLVDASFKNFARVQVVRSPLGTTVTYLERLPGQTDMLRVTRAVQESTDLLIAAWVAYAGEQPDFRAAPERLTRLKAFLETEFRTDLLNLGLTLWLEHTAGETYDLVDVSSNGMNSDERLMLRISLFLLERGYAQSTNEAMNDSTAPLRSIARKIATEIGVSAEEPLPETLAAFADSANSIENITSAGLMILGKSEENLTAYSELIVGNVIGDSPSGTVTWLDVPHQPMTNGVWDAKSQSIVWEAQFREGAQLPDVLFAFYALPDQAFQTEHFGRVLPLEKHRAFNAWYATLSAEQLARVATYCSNLRPGPELHDHILRFDLSAPDCRGLTASDPQKLPQGITAILPEK